MRIVVTHSGFAEVDRALSLLPQAVARKAALKALARGAKPLIDQARANAPRGERPYANDRTKNAMGPLFRSIKFRAMPGIQQEGVVGVVSADRAHFYDLWVEQGHDVVVGGYKRRPGGWVKRKKVVDAAKSARAKAGWETRRKNPSLKRVRYGTVVGRTRASRFLERALATTSEQIIQGVGEAFWASLQETAKGLETKAAAGTLGGSARSALEAGSPR